MTITKLFCNKLKHGATRAPTLAVPHLCDSPTQLATVDADILVTPTKCHNSETTFNYLLLRNRARVYKDP